MTGSEDDAARGDAPSLADRVAAWTPPWARPQPDEPALSGTDADAPAPAAEAAARDDASSADRGPTGDGDVTPAPGAAASSDDAVPAADELDPNARATVSADDVEPDIGASAPAGDSESAAEAVVPDGDLDSAGHGVSPEAAEVAGDLEASDDVQPVGGPEPVAEAEPQAAPAALRDRGSNDEAEPSRLAEPDGEPTADAVPVVDVESAADAVPVVDAEPEYQAGGAVVSEKPVGEPSSAEPPAPAAGAGPDAAGEARALPELDDPETLRSALEAILIVVDEPVSEVVLAQVLERPTATVAAAVRELAESYTRERRGFELRQAAGGWRIYTRDDFAPYVERFVLDGQQVRLTQAALETLAVVAYKQPVSRSRVSAIRGVNCDGVVRTLLTRGLIEECGAEPESGAYLYRTTTLFLERMGLNSTDELPDLAPFLPDELPEEAS